MDSIKAMIQACSEWGCAYDEQEPMSSHTSFRIGGPARLFIRPQDTDMAAHVLKKASMLELPLFIVGNGSNLLAPDEGIPGAVLSLDGSKQQPVMETGTRIRCPAGITLSRLCAFACENGLSGLEFAWGIPASVGGAVYMNAGAYGGEIKDVLSAVEYLDAQGELHKADAQALELSYRKSWFGSHPGNLITCAAFELSPDHPETIRERMERHMAARKEKQPLEYPSAGSTFKRPAGAYAAALIDRCGLRGYRHGGAMVSEKHAGFLINYDNASCKDVKGLIAEVQQIVLEKTGFLLECEVKFL